MERFKLYGRKDLTFFFIDNKTEIEYQFTMKPDVYCHTPVNFKVRGEGRIIARYYNKGLKAKIGVERSDEKQSLLNALARAGRLVRGEEQS